MLTLPVSKLSSVSVTVMVCLPFVRRTNPVQVCLPPSAVLEGAELRVLDVEQVRGGEDAAAPGIADQVVARRRNVDGDVSVGAVLADRVAGHDGIPQVHAARPMVDRDAAAIGAGGIAAE